MSQQQTDTDATGAFTVGTGRSDQSPRNILDIQPNWIADGFGVRGPQRLVQQETARPAEMPLSQPAVSSRGPDPTPVGENCDPGSGASTSIKYIKATQWNGSTWECVWLPTCAGTCDS